MQAFLLLQVRFALAIMIACLPLMPSRAHAQAWPDRPITFVVGVAPGGLIDLSARLLAKDLSVRLGQQIIIDNRPGANTTIGAKAVVRASGDGYTFFYGGAMSASPIFVKNNSVDMATELKPVSLVLAAPFFLLVNNKVPAENFQELVEYSKAHPDELNFANGAPLSTMVMYAIASRTGLSFVPVPYKGSAPSLIALISDEAHLALDTVPNYLPHIQEGTVRAVLNTSNSRYPLLPDVPSTADVRGLDFKAASVLSLWAPLSTPDDIVRRMSSEIGSLAQDPDFRARFVEATKVDPVGSSPEELLNAVQADQALYSQIAKQIGYEPQ